MYLVGLILSKTISKTKLHSMIQTHQLITPEIQQEINAVIEKDTTLNKEMKQLSELSCGCENTNTTSWTFPVLCTLLFPLMIFALIIFVVSGMQDGILLQIIGTIGSILNCFWI